MLVRIKELRVEGRGSSSGFGLENASPYLQFVVFSGSLLPLAWWRQIISFSESSFGVFLCQGVSSDSTF